MALVCGTYARRHDGVADYVGVLAETLTARGASPVVVSGAEPEGFVEPPRLTGDDDPADPAVVVVAPRWDVAGTRAAARALAGLAPDVVHLHFAPSAYRFSPAVGLLPLLLRQQMPARRAPIVTTLHEYGWWSWPARVPAPAWRPLERAGLWDRETGALAPRSAAVVTTNAAHARVVRERLRREPCVVPLAPNVPDAGWDRLATRAQVRAELGLRPQARLLVFFGFVHPVKGVRYLLEALATLRQDREDTHLLVVGGFPSLALPEDEAASFRREVEEHAAACGVTAATTFTGHVPAREASRLLSAADAAVLPFTAGVTTKSGSLLAAWAHRLPVVATAPDNPDPELRDGEGAVLVPARRDSHALAEGIARLFGDDGLRARVAAGGAARAAERSWERIADAHLRLYREVCREPPC